MRVMFIHNNFPAQFGGLASWLARQGDHVVFATQREGLKVKEFQVVTYKDHRAPTAGIHPYLHGTEQSVITGQAFARMAVGLRNRGYRPDVVVAHSGWGPGLFVKDVWPDTKLVNYLEWFYNFPATDRTPHDPERDELDTRARTRIRNATFLLDCDSADALISPTRFQADQFPQTIRRRITVLPDGIDTDLHVPGKRDAKFLESKGIPANAPLVTYIARGMEPARGFPEFMAAISVLQARRPDLRTVIIGEDRVAYGRKISDFSWKEHMLRSHNFDTSRLHFTGLVSRRDMVRFLQSSQAHVYLSAPFVLSWSLLEAMSCAAPIVASDNAAVRDAAAHGRNALLVDPTDADAVADAVERLLDDHDLACGFGESARRFILDRYDAVGKAFPRHRSFLQSVVRSDQPFAPKEETNGVLVAE